MTINKSKNKIRFYMAKKETSALLKRFPSVDVSSILSLEDFNEILPSGLKTVQKCLAYDCQPNSSCTNDTEAPFWIKERLSKQDVSRNGYLSLDITREPVFAKVTLSNSPDNDLYALWETNKGFVYYDLDLFQVIFFFVWESEVQFYCRNFISS